MKTSARRATKVDPQGRLTREDWIAGTIRKLSEDSVAALRVDVLADYLKVTKGSFYWHFKSREELLDAVLQSWRSLMTTGIKSLVGNEDDSAWDRMRKLLHIAISARPDVPGGPFELTLRDWARRDPTVAKVVQEVDDARMTFVVELYREAGLDADSAKEYATAQMAYVIGGRTAFSVSAAEIARRRKIAEQLFLPRHLSKKPGK